jgi:hypothetical protein
MGLGFWKIFAVLYSAGFTVATLFTDIWRNAKTMITCSACEGSVASFLKSLGALFFTPQELVSEGVGMLSGGQAGEYASFHWNQIFVGSLITIFLLVLIYKLYRWMVSEASMNAVVAAMVFLGVIFTFWVIQLSYTGLVEHEVEWVPFPGWVDLVSEYGSLPSSSDGLSVPLNESLVPSGDAQVIL